MDLEKQDVSELESILEFVRGQGEDAKERGLLVNIEVDNAPKRADSIYWLLLKYIVTYIEPFDYEVVAMAIRFLDKEEEYITSFAKNHIDEIKPSYRGDVPVWEVPAKLIWGILELLIEKKIEREKR